MVTLQPSPSDSPCQTVALTKRILIVDDHPDVRQNTRAIIALSRPNWEICGESANGQDAIAAAEKLAPDVVVLDLTMPGMNGFEAARSIKQLGLKTRILVFSIHDSAGFVVEARHAGADGYVLKSRAGRDLVQAIESLLSGDTAFFADSGEAETLRKV